MDALLKVDALNYSYHSLNGETLALRDLSFEVAVHRNFWVSLISAAVVANRPFSLLYSVFCLRTKERSP